MNKQHDPDFYRKFIGLTQCSAEHPLNIVIADDSIVIKNGLSNVHLLTLSHAEFLEWSSHKILNKAGVEIK